MSITVKLKNHPDLLFMKILKTFLFLGFVLMLLSYLITRDGNTYTPSGDGEVILDSGTYEAFPLPDYAAA